MDDEAFVDKLGSEIEFHSCKSTLTLILNAVSCTVNDVHHAGHVVTAAGYRDLWVD